MKSATRYYYCVLQFRPCELRNESVNVGVVVFTEDGVDIRILRTTAKLRALVSGLEDDLLPGAVNEIKALASRSHSMESRYVAIKHLHYFQCSPLGTFEADSSREYKVKVAQLFKEWVLPLPQLPEPLVRSELVFNKLRKRLDDLNVLTTQIGETEYGMVMPHFPLDSENRIFADYAYRSTNGWNLIETVNLAAPMDRLKKILVYKAFVFNQAKLSLSSSVHVSLVYEGGKFPGNDNPVARAVMENTDELIDLSSEIETTTFLRRIRQEATPNLSFIFH